MVVPFTPKKCFGCPSRDLFICRRNRHGVRLAMCLECWNRVELALEEME